VSYLNITFDRYASWRCNARNFGNKLTVQLSNLQTISNKMIVLVQMLRVCESSINSDVTIARISVLYSHIAAELIKLSI